MLPETLAFPVKRSLRKMLGAVPRRSARLNGRMRSETIRPAPECVSAPAAGVALPVRMKRVLVFLSTRRRTASHTGGYFCRSSTQTRELC